MERDPITPGLMKVLRKVEQARREGNHAIGSHLHVFLWMPESLGGTSSRGLSRCEEFDVKPHLAFDDVEEDSLEKSGLVRVRMKE